MRPILVLFALLASPQVYRFEPAHTEVEYSVDSTLHTVHGTFALKRGTLQIDPETGRAEGELVVDAASGSSGSAARDKRMTRDILEAQKYPDIVFTPDRLDGKLAAEGKSEVKLHGVLAIHGAQHEIVAAVTINPVPDGYDATAQFDVPYIEWGMKNPSNFLLKVDKIVHITIHSSRIGLRPVAAP